jgi:hypothetical protein
MISNRCDECGSDDGLRRFSAEELAELAAEGLGIALAGLRTTDPPGPFLYAACGHCRRFRRTSANLSRFRGLSAEEAWSWVLGWRGGPPGLGWTDQDWARWKGRDERPPGAEDDYDPDDDMSGSSSGERSDWDPDELPF